MSGGVNGAFDAVTSFVVDATATHGLAEVVKHRPWRPWQVAQVTLLSLCALPNPNRHDVTIQTPQNSTFNSYQLIVCIVPLVEGSFKAVYSDTDFQNESQMLRRLFEANPQTTTTLEENYTRIFSHERKRFGFFVSSVGVTKARHDLKASTSTTPLYEARVRPTRRERERRSERDA